MSGNDCKEKIRSRQDEVIDDDGNYVSPFDDDYEFWKDECVRRNDPLDDDYVREEYR